MSCQQPAPRHQLCEWVALEADSPASSKPSKDCNPDQHLDYNLMKDLKQEPAKNTPKPLIYRNYVGENKYLSF